LKIAKRSYGLSKSTHFSNALKTLAHLCPTRGRVGPSLGFRCSKSILRTDTCPCFDNFEFDIFDTGGLK